MKVFCNLIRQKHLHVAFRSTMEQLIESPQCPRREPSPSSLHLMPATCGSEGLRRGHTNLRKFLQKMTH